MNNTVSHVRGPRVEEGTELLRVFLPVSLKRAIEHAAVDEETSVTKLVESMARDYLKQDVSAA